MTGGPGSQSVGERAEDESGLGSKFQPEPPDPNKLDMTFLERPSVSSHHSELGEIREEHVEATASSDSGDVAMEVATAARKEVEVVHATQF